MDMRRLELVVDRLRREAEEAPRTGPALQKELARLTEMARAECAIPAEQRGKKLWLWKNGDHFLAFDNEYPCVSPGGDPMVLGEPIGYAIFMPSSTREAKPLGRRAGRNSRLSAGVFVPASDESLPRVSCTCPPWEVCEKCDRHNYLSKGDGHGQ